MIRDTKTNLMTAHPTMMATSQVAAMQRLSRVVSSCRSGIYCAPSWETISFGLCFLRWSCIFLVLIDHVAVFRT